MKINGFKQFICPLEGELLSENASGWSCPHGHHFDRAKEGYVNLLPAHFKRSKDPGDSKAMVTARGQFLQANYYEPLASFLADLISAYQESLGDHASGTLTCLDAGCGEGYYLRAIADQLSWDEQDVFWQAVGVDISKWAVQAAAKKAPQLSWVVASNAQLPVPSASFDILLNVFGFAVYEEFHRVVKKEGMLIEVNPGPEHLKELREVISSGVPTKDEPTREAGAGFKTFERRTIRYKVILERPEDIQNLLTMTPHRYRISQERIIAVEQLTSLEVTVQFEIHLMSKGVAGPVTLH